MRDLQDRFPKAQLIGGDADFERIVATVVGFVEAPARGLDLPLDVRGTAFQQRVWQALREIPAGATASYAEIAARIGAPEAVRAVAQACAANRDRRRHSLPPRRAHRRRALRLPLGRRAQARPARAGGRRRERAQAQRRGPGSGTRRTSPTGSPALDWPRIAADLDADGCAP